MGKSMKTWKYRVSIFKNDKTIIIESPIACRGSISRGLFSNGNKAEIELYNLALSTRNEIYQDPFMGEKSAEIRVEVGYSEDDTVQQIFYGRILQAYSSRSSGSTEVVTKISALCIDLFNTSSVTFEAGTEKKDAIKKLASDLPNVTLNALGNIGGVFKTPTTFDGNTLEQINKIAGGVANIDNDQLNVCLLNEVIDVAVPIISQDTVLLETPIRKGMQLELNFIMQPYLQVNQLLQIDSKIYPDFNGQYKVIGFTHNFLISESVAGTKTTKATVLIGDELPLSTNSVKGSAKEEKFCKVKKEDITPIIGSVPTDVYGVYNYLNKNSGKIPSTKITPSISWEDMLGHSNQPGERVKELNIAKLSNCHVIATNLQRMINNSPFKGKKISVTSAWRSVRNNQASGGVANSKHLSGLAVDFHIEGANLNSVYSYAKQYWTGGIGYVYCSPTKNFVHLQIDYTNKLVNDV